MTPEKGPKSFGAFEERASVFNPKTVSNPKWRRWTKVTCFPGGGGGGGGGGGTAKYGLYTYVPL